MPKRGCPVRYLLILVFLISSFVFSGYGKNSGQKEDFLKKGAFEGKYWPTLGWKSCYPEDVGMDSATLMSVYDYVANPAVQTRGVAIIRKGYIVAETYFNGLNQYSRHPSYSVAKSFVSALIGIGLEQGIFKNIEEPIFHYFPELNKKKKVHIRGSFLQNLPAPGARKRITIEHLLTMSSGLKWNEQDYFNDPLNDVYLMADSYDYIQYVLNKSPEYEPGIVWRYSSGDSMLLSGLFTRVLGVSAYEFGQEYLFEPLGITNIIWHTDPAGHTIGGWGIEATIREYAKFGYLYSKKGRWERRQVIPEPWIYESWEPVSESIDFYGYQWWLLPVFEGHEDSIIPEDTYIAWGLYTQQIFVIPSKDLVIVRMADDPGSSEWDELEFLTRIMKSLRD
jgi:CubicO group peptidase (beta-lactamase class C family)